MNRDLKFKVNAGINIVITEKVIMGDKEDEHVLHAGQFVRGWPDELNEKRLMNATLFYHAHELLAAAEACIASQFSEPDVMRLKTVVNAAKTPPVSFAEAIKGLNDKPSAMAILRTVAATHPQQMNIQKSPSAPQAKVFDMQNGRPNRHNTPREPELSMAAMAEKIEALKETVKQDFENKGGK